MTNWHSIPHSVVLPYLFFGLDGSVIMDDSTQCGDHSSGPMHYPKLTNGMVIWISLRPFSALQKT